MAVIHISEAEAGSNFTAVLDHVRAGDHVLIGDVAQVVPTVATHGPGRPISEILRALEARTDADVLLDDQFGDDMEAVYAAHRHERVRDPWECS